MGKKIILAVAGAGKTYTICKNLDPLKKNLILAFTHENIHNINKELINIYGEIPKLTNVMTYHSFLFRYIICPFKPSILKHFGKEKYLVKGITMKKPPEQFITFRGKNYPNKQYKKKEEFEHYIYKNQWYCDTMSQLILQVKKGRDKLLNKSANTINMFYDYVFIDEFQDFRKDDFNLIIDLSKLLNNVTLVGDYFQHSVSGRNNTGKPFDKMDNDMFIKFLKDNKFEVDTNTLVKSRRCPKMICDFVENKLKIKFECNNSNIGEVCWVDRENINCILENDNITKLVWNSSHKYNFNAVNWGYSKGDTYSDVCVLLTKNLSNLDQEAFDIEDVSEIIRNKLYVAITRTKGNLYLVKKELFDQVKDSYLKVK